MSRVYEALRKAAGQHSVEEQPTIEPAVASETVRPFAANRSQTQFDPVVSGRLQTKPAFAAHERLERPSTSSPDSFDANAYCEESLTPHTDLGNRAPLLVIGHMHYPTVAEQFHRLSLSLQSWAAENDKRIFTIMSALSKDGKSFVAVNLAASLAMSGNRVILVDGDLRQPALHHSFNMVAAHGLIGYIKGEIEFSECLQPTAIPGLLLVPAGGTSYTPAELLASPRMRDFIREARSVNPAHYLIIDSPASSLVPEPQILSRLGDASLVVVAANRTPRELVKQTIEVIGGTPVFGLVLNRFEAPYSTIPHYPDRYAGKLKAGAAMRDRVPSGTQRSNLRGNPIRSLIDHFSFALRFYSNRIG